MKKKLFFLFSSHYCQCLKLLLFFFISQYSLFHTPHSFGQQKAKTDSLELLLKTSRHDSTRLKIMNELYWEYYISEPEKGLKLAKQGLSIAEKLASNSIGNLTYQKAKARSYINIGNIHFIQSTYPLALENYLKANKIYDDLGDKKGVTNTLTGVGNIYFTQGNHALALEYYFKTLKFWEEENNEKGMSGSYNNIGNIYFKQGNYQLALEYHGKSLAIKEKLGDKKGLTSSYGNMGDVYYEMGNYPLALEYQLKTLKLREENNNRKGVAGSYISLGSIYAKQGQHEKAIESQNKALEVANEIGYKEAAKSAYGALATVYEEQNDHKKALQYFKLFNQVKDSIFNDDNAKSIAELSTKYETEKKQKEIALLTKEQQVQHLIFQQQQAELLKERLESEKKENEISLLNKTGKIRELELERSANELIQQKLKTKTKANEVEIQEAALSRQRLLIYSVIGGLILLLLLAFVLYNRYQLKQKANVRLEKAYQQIEEKNKDITDSIKYAQRIQEAILPPGDLLNKLLPESFILFKPKDIVSGDFFWVEQWGERILIAAVDCTGHGVPGAFMSIVGHNLLNQSVNEHGLSRPSLILNELNKGLTATLRQKVEESDVKDGMDIALCSIDFKKRVLEFAGAYNPIWIVKGQQLVEIKGDKQPIGTFLGEELKPFTNHEVQLEKGDTIYIFTDGYADQFGGPKGKKFKFRKMQELILSLQDKPMKEQKEILDKKIEKWRGGLEQVDDILVIGIRI